MEKLINALADSRKEKLDLVADSRADTIAAIRALERSVVQALDGGALDGAKNIGGPNASILAWRVRGKDPDQRIMFPGRGEKPVNVLAILPVGKLFMLRCVSDKDGYPHIDVRPVEDEDLRTDDLPAYIWTLTQIIPRHLAIAASKHEHHRALSALAQKVLQMLSATVEEGGE